MSNSSPFPSLLIEQTKHMLAFWDQKTRRITPETMKFLEAERHNLFHAVKVGLGFQETGEDTAVILSQTMPFIAQRGYWRDWIPLLQRSLNGTISPYSPNRIYLMISLGQAYRLDTQLDKAITIHKEAEQLVRETSSRDLLAQVQHELLEDYFFSRAYGKAKTTGQSAIEILEQSSGPATLIANCYKMLGSVYYETAETETAELYFSKAVTMWRKIGDPVHLARTLNDLSRLYLTDKRYAAAEGHLNEAAMLLAPTINELDKCMIYINLGSVYAAQQQWHKAEIAFQKANSPYLRQSIDLPRKARVNNNLGYVLFKQGEYENAEEYLEHALQLWQQVGDDLEYANTLSIQADNVLAWQRAAAACPLYEQLLALLADYPQNSYAQKLQAEYTAIYDQVKRETK